MRADKLLVATILAVALAGCVDEPVSVAPGGGRVVLAPSFTFAGPAGALPIEIVQLRPIILEGETGTPLPAVRVSVNPGAATFRVRAPIDMGDRDSAFVFVLVEMISLASGSELVEWSGQIGPIQVRADEANPLPNEVVLLRGPLENQGVLGIFASGPSFMSLGTTHPAHASVETTGASHTVFWLSRNENVVTVDPVGDSIDVFANGPGNTWVVAAAGAHADSFQVTVSTVTSNPVAQVIAVPDSAVMIVSSTRQWQAIAVDSMEFPVSTPFTWQALDPGIATVSTTGVVTAQALGRARIVVSASGAADTAIVNVQNLPPGVDLLWQGGVAGASNDWFTADNWSPSRVPTSADAVYLPDGVFVSLNANASVGSVLADSMGGSILDIQGSVLTVHDDLRTAYVFGDSTARIVMIGNGAQLRAWSIPSLTVLGDVSLTGEVFVDGDVVVDGVTTIGHLDIGDTWYVYASGDVLVTNGSIGLADDDSTYSAGGLYVEGDVTFDGGNSAATLTGGTVLVGGDFTVTSASCTAFAPTGGWLELYSDTAAISIGCSGPSGNRPYNLEMYQRTSGLERIVTLLSDVHVANELYLDGGDGTRVIGNGHTIFASSGSLYLTTLDRAFLEITASTGFSFYLDNLTFTGMTGETAPQLVYTETADGCPTCYQSAQIFFDPTSAGPYVHVIDVVDGDSTILYMSENPGDGPSRTALTGEAAVHWADVPVHLVYEAGSGQTGAPSQPLPDSLVVQVWDYAFHPVAGTTIDWTVTQGNGSVSPTSSETDVDGEASTQLTLGDSLSPINTVIATSTALPSDSVVFYGYPNTAPAGVARPTAENHSLAPPERGVAPALERRRPPAWPQRPARVEPAGTSKGDRP